MIGWLSGIVVHRDARQGVVVLNVGGVGYELRVSLQTLAAVGDPDEHCALWVHTHAREDALLLFGFATQAEKQLFLLLTGVPKVGPKHAMAVLGGFPLAELVDHLTQGREVMLTKIPGIGKKTAEQILLSLADKVASFAAELEGPPRGPAPAKAEPEPPAIVEEAKQVLVDLGWRVKEVEVALAKLTAGGPVTASLDDLVRRTLAQLMER
ncbi:Holliday junction DNA helicase subunit RuvA [Nannocystis exedens]|uniref:Holliday junction branch migration complex subunit RuvA n=1 Tax=Nannocystis exedens TaxID=54 RepID=A0A1I1WDU6_9BACT|nr:Holliday junction branch migration protein RuvA [Nannocystis exedens]PCC67514.1 Holliday junction DNA helicase motor protein [Nannocystis exedens]SFD91260.1 Holliday junction DNA helicase subunit RuvA [Nannocystis exedens]